MSALYIVPGLIIGIILHEMGHAWADNFFGDDTAKRQGRLDWSNLQSHIDPLRTIVLPILGLLGGGFIFGWAKPVPVDITRLRPYRLGMIVVALAGRGCAHGSRNRLLRRWTRLNWRDG